MCIRDRLRSLKKLLIRLMLMMKSARNNMQNLLPVSYTHLDVYKRQPQVDTEAAHHKDHRIILAYQVTHLTCFPVFSVLHVSHIFYYLYSRLIISMHIEVHPPVRQLCIPFRSASPDGTREHEMCIRDSC